LKHIIQKWLCLPTWISPIHIHKSHLKFDIYIYIYIINCLTFNLLIIYNIFNILYLKKNTSLKLDLKFRISHYIRKVLSDNKVIYIYVRS